MSKLKHCLVAVLLAAGILCGPQLLSQEETVIAVLDFQNLSGRSDLNYLAKAVPEILITGLALSEKIRVVERTRLVEILEEMKLSLSGAADPETDKVVEVGKLAGAGAVLLGSIIRSGDDTRVNCRLINVSTGEVMLAEKKEWSAESEAVEAVDDLAEEIVRKLTGEKIKIEATQPETTEADYPKGRYLAMEATLDNRYRSAGSDEAVYLLVEIFSRQMKAKKRVPLNISLVLDRSGSMAQEKKLGYVKEAAEFVVNHLSASDVFSLVTYESQVQTPIESRHADNKEAFLAEIRKITPGGGTNLSGGMLEGFAQVAKKTRKGQVDRVLLLSDGMANQGITAPAQLEKICREKAGEGISLSTFGVGAHYNEYLMLALSEHGNGYYYFIDISERIPEIISKELKGLLAVAAQNVRIEVVPADGVSVEQVYGYKSESEGNVTSVTMGDIFSNDHRSIIFRLGVAKGRKGKLDLAKVKLCYDEAAAGGKRIEETSGLSLTYTSDEDLVAQNESRYVGQKVGLFRSAIEMRKVVDMVNEGKMDEARGLLARETSNLQDNAKRYQTADLKAQLLNYSRYNELLERYGMMTAEQQKMMNKANQHYQYYLSH